MGTKGREKLRMHSLVNNTPKGAYTDHINGDKLDNRRSNLRTVTSSENSMNRKIHYTNISGHKGVRFDPKIIKNPYNARIWHENKRISLGSFETAEEAHQAYIKAGLRLFGKFFRAN